MTQTSIIATAALPWRTGTATLPANRAYYLAQTGMEVTLYLPWVSPEQQSLLTFGTHTFERPEDQEAYIRAYLPQGDQSSLHIQFYPAKYYSALGSILPKVSLAKFIAPCEWLLLEEPEHLNWLHPFQSYRSKAKTVTGIILTNYIYYIGHHLPAGKVVARVVNRYSQWLIGKHCDTVIRIAASLPKSPRDTVQNIGGVHPEFLVHSGKSTYSKPAYFMGKMIWEKGFRELIDLLSQSDLRQLDVWGNGNHRNAILEYADQSGVTFHCMGISEQPPIDLADYRMLINVSRSEASCTVTAEALALGKFAIVPRHSSNEFFYDFKNCLVYETPEEFQAHLHFALNNIPEDDPNLNWFSWEAAVGRLLQHKKESDLVA